MAAFHRSYSQRFSQKAARSGPHQKAWQHEGKSVRAHNNNDNKTDKKKSLQKVETILKWVCRDRMVRMM